MRMLIRRARRRVREGWKQTAVDRLARGEKNRWRWERRVRITRRYLDGSRERKEGPGEGQGRWMCAREISRNGKRGVLHPHLER